MLAQVVLCGDLNVDRLSDAHRARAAHGHGVRTSSGNLNLNPLGPRLLPQLHKQKYGTGSPPEKDGHERQHQHHHHLHHQHSGGGGGGGVGGSGGADEKEEEEEAEKEEEEDEGHPEAHLEEHIGAIGERPPHPVRKKAGAMLEEVLHLDVEHGPAGEGEFVELLPWACVRTLLLLLLSFLFFSFFFGRFVLFSYIMALLLPPPPDAGIQQARACRHNAEEECRRVVQRSAEEECRRVQKSAEECRRVVQKSAVLLESKHK